MGRGEHHQTIGPEYVGLLRAGLHAAVASAAVSAAYFLPQIKVVRNTRLSPVREDGRCHGKRKLPLRSRRSLPFALPPQENADSASEGWQAGITFGGLWGATRNRASIAPSLGSSGPGRSSPRKATGKGRDVDSRQGPPLWHACPGYCSAIVPSTRVGPNRMRSWR